MWSMPTTGFRMFDHSESSAMRQTIRRGSGVFKAQRKAPRTSDVRGALDSMDEGKLHPLQLQHVLHRRAPHRVVLEPRLAHDVAVQAVAAVEEDGGVHRRRDLAERE